MRPRGADAAIATLLANASLPRVRQAASQQYAALAWRFGRRLEILLLTSRRSGRWIIPKGWPIEGLSGPASAAQEAFEEGGVVGRVSFERLGSFRYTKRLRDGLTIVCKVDVYPLEVSHQQSEWPEMKERQARWCTPQEAAGLVKETDLKLLIRRFTRLHHPAGLSAVEK